MGLLKSLEREDYETAARYLEPTPGRNTNLAQRAKELRTLQGGLDISIGFLSDDPNGTVEPGVPPGQVRVGVLAAGGTTADIMLVRVDDPAFGKIWLISKETVASVPKLYAQVGNEAATVAGRIMPAALTTRRVAGMSLAQWLAWLLSIQERLIASTVEGNPT
jgi:hypothetical protein